MYEQKKLSFGAIPVFRGGVGYLVALVAGVAGSRLRRSASHLMVKLWHSPTT